MRRATTSQGYICISSPFIQNTRAYWFFLILLFNLVSISGDQCKHVQCFEYSLWHHPISDTRSFENEFLIDMKVLLALIISDYSLPLHAYCIRFAPETMDTWEYKNN